MRTDGKEAAKILGTVRDLKKGNRDLLRYLGVAEEDFPEGPVAPHVVAIPDTLESVLTTHWPAWDVERQRIVGQRSRRRR
ncbi:hypothetical protein FXW78_22360 [Rhodococcus opacus]|nr:hypothetical protein [Rhodococcus opacus]